MCLKSAYRRQNRPVLLLHTDIIVKTILNTSLINLQKVTSFFCLIAYFRFMPSNFRVYLRTAHVYCNQTDMLIILCNEIACLSS